MDRIDSYVVLKVLQLEGRLPEDAGAWPVSVYRIFMGWGYPSPEDLPAIEFTPGEPYPAPPTIDSARLKINRTHAYYRIRTSEDAAKVASLQPKAAFEVFPHWADAPGGEIELPKSGAKPVGSHDILLVDHDSAKKAFLFQNWWGPDWGLGGYGILSDAYFDRWLIESWMPLFVPGLDVKAVAVGKGIHSLRWQAPSLIGSTVHVREVYDSDSDDRLGWAIVVEREFALDVEEFFVRPQDRGVGHGSRLADMLSDLSRERDKPLNLWVPFADSRTQSPSTIPPMTKIVRRMGLTFQPTGVRWAAYLATPSHGTPEPVEPAHVPARPQSTRDALLAAALALANSSEPTRAPAPPSSANGILRPETAQRRGSADELLAPFRREVEESGISDDELDSLFERAREEVWREKKQGRHE